MAPHSSRVQPLSGAQAQLTKALCKAIATAHCVFYTGKQPSHKGEKKSKGGIGFGCRTRNEGKPKPLQTRRPRLANALLAVQQAGQRVLWVHHLPQLKDLTDQKGSLVHSTWMYPTETLGNDCDLTNVRLSER
ncbi:unnamed protein product [Pleuronectes platessa]|uniref:Uncharacterized protein n=1 Tax=Pleuronectes platessa TaxID=8262 RepID=A0A9N7YUD8_PLEPL|nr:unnamed protein product [Pleuronectes platessa]